MCVYVCICIYIYIYICMYAYIYIYIHIHTEYLHAIYTRWTSVPASVDDDHNKQRTQHYIYIYIHAQ